MKKCTWCGKIYSDDCVNCQIDNAPLGNCEQELKPSRKHLSAKKNLVFVSVALAIVIAVLFLYILGYGGALRRSAMITAHNDLKQARMNLDEQGTVEAFGSSKPFVFTNEIVIDGKVYRGSVGAHLNRFEEEGFLVMSTNQIFIWIDKKRGPKIITLSNYTPNLFPERF